MSKTRRDTPAGLARRRSEDRTLPEALARSPVVASSRPDATTINWTARVVAPFDVLSTNNGMTATTRVLRPRGGSGEGE